MYQKWYVLPLISFLFLNEISKSNSILFKSSVKHPSTQINKAKVNENNKIFIFTSTIAADQQFLIFPPKNKKQYKFNNLVNISTSLFNREREKFHQLKNTNSDIPKYLSFGERRFDFPMLPPYPSDFHTLKSSNLKSVALKNVEEMSEKKVLKADGKIFDGDIDFLQDIEVLIEFLLKKHEYYKYEFHDSSLTSNHGFVITTRMEYIDQAGKPLNGDSRWLPSNSSNKSISLAGRIIKFLSNFIDSWDKYQRFFAFIICKPNPTITRLESFDQDQSNPNRSYLGEYPPKGKSTLSKKISESTFDDDYTLNILIYEYVEHESDGQISQVIQVPPSHFDYSDLVQEFISN